MLIIKKNDMKHLMFFLLCLIYIAILFGIYKCGDIGVGAWFAVLSIPFTVAIITFFNKNYTND